MEQVNEGEVSETLIKDTVVPTLTLTSSLKVNALNMAAFLLEGACSEDEESVNITIADRAAVTALCTPTGWHYTADLETGLSDGNISLLLTLEDAAGNPVEESFTLNRNTALPTLTLDTSPLPPMNAENASAYSVQGDCDNGGYCPPVHSGSHLPHPAYSMRHLR